jgi:tRNA dimethylallyltransferase
MKPLIIIEGPTASGKSGVALQLAEKIGTEIISADSRQVYRYMNIGTAKPSVSDRGKVVHHLVDIVDPDEEYSAGQFISDAEKIIKKLGEEGKVPIICGGTGFYVKALLEGLFAAPEIPLKVKKEIEELEDSKGTNYLHTMLKHIDPESALRVHPNDSYRIKRALEIWIATGEKVGELWQRQSKEDKRYDPFRIMITEERDVIYERINRRLEKMIKDGLIDEIKELIKKGYGEKDPGMTSVGYREFLPYVSSNDPFTLCLEEAKKNTRNYAKRQFTWYRKIVFDLVLRNEGSGSGFSDEILKKFYEKEKKSLS